MRSKTFGLDIGSTSIKAVWLRKEREEFGGMTYFTLTLHLTRPDLLSRERRERVRAYVAFGMQADISLLVGGDTLAPGLYHCEQSGFAEEMRVLLAFDCNLSDRSFDSDAGINLLFEDRFFGTGPNVFSFNAKDIRRTPRVKL